MVSVPHGSGMPSQRFVAWRAALAWNHPLRRRISAILYVYNTDRRFHPTLAVRPWERQSPDWRPPPGFRPPAIPNEPNPIFGHSPLRRGADHPGGRAYRSARS